MELIDFIKLYEFIWKLYMISGNYLYVCVKNITTGRYFQCLFVMYAYGFRKPFMFSNRSNFCQ